MPGPIVTPLPPKTDSKGSPNKGMIDSLISTLQRNEILVPDDKVRKLGLQWLPAKLYDGLRKMNFDLNKAYDALFDGPLPPVDGYYLTRLNAAVLTGPIPESYHLAYTDRNNVFTRGQTIIWEEFDEVPDEPFLKMGFGDATQDPEVFPLSYLRIGSIIDEMFFLSQNTYWDGTQWLRDNDVTGASRIDFMDGDIVLNWWDDLLLPSADYRRTFTFRGREIKYGNFDQTVDFSLLYISDADVIKFASDATADGTGLPAGWPALPAAITANLPIAGAVADGVVGIDKTLHAFFFYVNGFRYRVVGTLF